MNYTLEIVVLPVADVDRSKAFYEGLGFRLDADFTSKRGLRVVQLTPRGSGASIMVGDHLTDAAPGSVDGLHLIVDDLERARAELVAGGADVSEMWHDRDGVFHWAGDDNRVAGPHPDTDSYGSFASFRDPDGNGWTLQQVVTRRPGRLWSEAPAGPDLSAEGLRELLVDTARAHGVYEETELGGRRDEAWPDWYARHLAASLAARTDTRPGT